MSRTSTTLTMEIHGAAYEYVVKKVSEKKAENIGGDKKGISMARVINDALRRLNSFETMIADGSLVIVQPSVGRVVSV